MGKYFDQAYDYAMTKIAAFDVDEEEDQRLYNKIKDDPRTNEWLEETHRDLKKNRNSLRNFALGTGAVGLGSGIIGAASKSARPIALPVAIGSGILSAAGGIGAINAHGDLKDYDRDTLGARRRHNIDRYLSRNGSRFGGRKAEYQVRNDRVNNTLNSMILADAILSR